MREILKKRKSLACIYLFSSGFSYIRPEMSIWNIRSRLDVMKITMYTEILISLS